MTKIESLTKEQQARFPEFVERWKHIGLSTEPANRPAAEAAIKKLYHCASLAEPKKIVWCDSPLSQGIVRAICIDKKLVDRESVMESVGASVGESVGESVGGSVRESVGASVRESVGASVRESVRESVWASVGESVWASVGASVWASVGASVGESVGGSVGASVWESVWASVWESVGASVGESVRASVMGSVWASVGGSVWASVWASCYGQHDANWLGFFEYFRVVCGLEADTEKLVGLIEQAQHAGWFLPHAEICWVSERHNIVHADSNGRLHCENGLACGYPDGWGVYSWHGTRVPEKVILAPDKLTPSEVMSEQNAEVKRVMIERYGFDRLMLDAGAKTLHKRGDYELIRVDSDHIQSGKMVAVKMICPSTGAVYILRVPPEMRTVEESMNWIKNVPKGQDYFGSVELQT